MTDVAKAEVGFVGLGNVGLPAAVNLLADGVDVLGYDVRPMPAFVEAGGRMAKSLGDVAQRRVIIQSLPSVAALEASTTALLPALAPGTIVADISSYPIEDKLRAAERLADAGAIMLDCEISGLPFMVANRSAVIFASGETASIQTIRPLLASFSTACFELGPFGAATKMKLIANYMVCAHNLVGAEALNLARRVGLDPAQVAEVLKPSAAGSTTFANKSPLMLSRSFDEGKGPFGHMFGYLDRAMALAAEAGAANATPLLARTREVYGIARDQNRHRQDIAAIIEIVEQLGEEGK